MEKVPETPAHVAHVAQIHHPFRHSHSSRRSLFDSYRVPSQTRTNSVSPFGLITLAPRDLIASANFFGETGDPPLSRTNDRYAA
jgi:hypothetical protein